MRRARRRQPGQVIVLAAVLMVAMLAMAAFVVDAGFILETRRELQNAADTGALAGVHVLPDAPPDGFYDLNAPLDADDFAAMYALTTSDSTAARLCRTEPTVDEVVHEVWPLGAGIIHTLNVTMSCEVGFTVGRILGLTDMQVAASARAALGALKNVQCPLPFGVAADKVGGDEGLEFNTLVELKVGTGDSGNFQLMSLTGSSASANEIRQWLAQNCGEGFDLEVGSEGEADTAPGGKIGAVRGGLTDRGLVSCPGNSPLCGEVVTVDGTTYVLGNHQHDRVCPDRFSDVVTLDVDGSAMLSQPDHLCLGVVPLVESFVDANGRTTLRVLRWGLFFIEAWENPETVVLGRFVKASAIGDIAAFDPDAILVIRLIR